MGFLLLSQISTKAPKLRKIDNNYLYILKRELDLIKEFFLKKTIIPYSLHKRKLEFNETAN